MKRIVLSLPVALLMPSASAEEFEMAVLRPGRAPTHYTASSSQDILKESPLDPKRTTPLGSVWKLFVYSYLAEKKLQPSAYTCRGQDPEEIFCCQPGKSVGLDEALAKSCGLYFAPTRLELSENDWREFWKSKTKRNTPWLLELRKLRPEAKVSIAELLEVLESLRQSMNSFPQIEGVLAEVLIHGTAKGSVRDLGSTLRVKTYTWDKPGSTEAANVSTASGADSIGGAGAVAAAGTRYVGGFAGWLADGSSVWAQGPGTGATVIAGEAKRITALSQSISEKPSGECVNVAFFDRYPIAEVVELPEGKPASSGVLRGRYRVKFRNGQKLEILSGGELRLDRDWRISGQFSMNEYVARVLQREVSPEPVEAARAFGVLIRTYLHQNSKLRGTCHEIADTTRLQRVSPIAPSAEALKIASWSEGLVLKGEARVHYHSDRSSPGVLGWTPAVKMAREGTQFDEILRTGFPALRLGYLDSRRPVGCERLSDAEAWLKNQRRKWSARLAGVQGYQEPETLKICRSQTSQPYSDSERNVIYLRYLGGFQDQLTVAHEYLHLAFKYHPSGRDESFVETHAKALMTGQELRADYEKM